MRFQDLLETHERASYDGGTLVPALIFRIQTSYVDVLDSRPVSHLVEHVLERALHFLIDAWYRAFILLVGVLLTSSIRVQLYLLV